VTIIDSNSFQEILQAKRAELLVGAAKRDEIRIENAAEEIDRLQQRMNREVAIRNLDRESKLLRSIEEALDRMKNGTFGLCSRCEEEIPEKRLQAVPWASHCLSCQETLDRRELEDDSDILRHAA
jgi:DnaK suppressor protein